MSKLKGDERLKRTRNAVDLLGDFSSGLRGNEVRHERFYKYTPFPAFIPYFASKKKVKFVCGGNRSGKTLAGIIESIMVYTGIVPEALQSIYPHKIPTNRPRLVRIITMSYTKHWPETIKRMLLDQEKGYLPEGWSNYNEQDHIFYGPDGSMLSIMAIDPTEDIDPNILRGADVDHTQIDEINQEAVFSESFTRASALKDGPKTVTLTYCPQNGLESWEYERLWKKVFNTTTRMYLPPEKQDRDIFGIKVTMRDNPLISEEERQKAISVLRSWEVAFRVDGEYSQKASSPYFKMEPLLAWEKEAQSIKSGVAYKIEETDINTDDGIFKANLEEVDIGPSDELQDYWYLWETPKVGEKYIMVADPAEGNEESDPSVVDIWRCTDPARPVQVAQIRQRSIRPGELAVQACCMATIFGECLLVPEVNNTAGGMFMDRCRGYKNIYKRAKGLDKQIVTDETERIGWATTRITKPLALENLYKMILEWSFAGYCPLSSRQTLYELMAYEEKVIKDKMGKFVKVEWGSKQGSNDDCVMVAAIANRVIKAEYHKITTSRVIPKCVKKDVDSEDWTLPTFDNEQKRQRAFSGLRPVKHIAQCRIESRGRNGTYQRR